MPAMMESDKTILDMVDVLLESWKIPREITLEDGTVKIERVIDEHRAWYQTHHIGSTAFGSYAKERENLGNLFKLSSYHMTENRSLALLKQGLLLCQAYDYSIDAKSSEAIRDEHNAQFTVLSLLAKAKMERQITLKGQAKESVMDSLLARKADQASN